MRRTKINKCCELLAQLAAGSAVPADASGEKQGLMVSSKCGQSNASRNLQKL